VPDERTLAISARTERAWFAKTTFFEERVAADGRNRNPWRKIGGNCTLEDALTYRANGAVSPEPSVARFRPFSSTFFEERFPQRTK